MFLVHQEPSQRIVARLRANLSYRQNLSSLSL
nr:MAG TPA: hypothetical protein [Caudoviricetes sp.]